jgi:hypothetical protein
VGPGLPEVFLPPDVTVSVKQSRVETTVSAKVPA